MGHEDLALLAASAAGGLAADRPSLHPDEVSEIAYEAWWNLGIHDCEGLGLDPDDAQNQDAWCTAYVAHYDTLRATADGSKWTDPALRSLVTRLPPELVARVDGFLMASQVDAEPDRDAAAYASLLGWAAGLDDERPGRFKGRGPRPGDDPGWSELFGPAVHWGAVEARLGAFIGGLPRDAANDARDWLFREVTTALRIEPEGHETWTAALPVLEAAGIAGGTLTRRCVQDVWAGLADAPAPVAPRRVTSMGRWFVTLSFERVFDDVVERMRVSYYAGLLLHAAPQVYEANREALEAAIATRPAWRVDVAHAMLSVAPETYEATVLNWLDGLESPALQAPLLTYVALAFGDRHRDRVLAGTAAALGALGGGDVAASDAHRLDPDLEVYAAFPNSSVKLCLVAVVLRAFGARALDAVRPYQCDNVGWRIRNFEILARWVPGDARAAAILIEGLEPELEAHLGGDLTRKKYYRRLAAALAVYDLGPHQAAIAAAAARIPDDGRRFVQALRM